MRNDLGGLADLSHGAAELAHNLPLVGHGQLDEVDRIATNSPMLLRGLLSSWRRPW